MKASSILYNVAFLMLGYAFKAKSFDDGAVMVIPALIGLVFATALLHQGE